MERRGTSEKINMLPWMLENFAHGFQMDIHEDEVYVLNQPSFTFPPRVFLTELFVNNFEEIEIG